MMAEPAAALGLPLRLLAEAEGVSAAQVIPDHLVGDYRDLPTLRRVADGCEVVTFDHEHVPTEHLHALAGDGIAVRPGPEALVHAQDKAVMRARLGELGLPCPRNAVVSSVADVEAFAATLPLYQRIRAELRQGPQTREQLAEALDAKPETLRRTINRGIEKGHLVKFPGPGGVERIGLPARQSA